MNARVTQIQKSDPTDLKNGLKNCAHQVGEFIWETPPKLALFAIIGVACQLIYPKLAPPFHAITLSSTLSRLAVKVVSIYDQNSAVKINRTLVAMTEKTPYLETIILIIAITSAWQSVFTSIVLGSAYGLFQGLLAMKSIKRYEQNALRYGTQPQPKTRPLLNS